MPDVRSRLLDERRRLVPGEDEATARARVQAVGGRSALELEALLARIQRTRRFDESVAWLQSAGEGLPRPLYEVALRSYADSAVLGWEDCVRLARFGTWTTPAFEPWRLNGSARH